MRSIIVIILAMMYLLSPQSLYCSDNTAKTDIEGTIYSYDSLNPPEVFFFPKEKARWDGSKVTMREWYMLTDFQKERFIKEYLQELQKQYNDPINVMFADYLKALNVFSYYSNDNTMNEPSTKFIDKMLSGQGKLEK